MSVVETRALCQVHRGEQTSQDCSCILGRTPMKAGARSSTRGFPAQVHRDDVRPYCCALASPDISRVTGALMYHRHKDGC